MPHSSVLENCPACLAASVKARDRGDGKTRTATKPGQGASMDFAFAGQASKNSNDAAHMRSNDCMGIHGETCCLCCTIMQLRDSMVHASSQKHLQLHGQEDCCGRMHRKMSKTDTCSWTRAANSTSPKQFETHSKRSLTAMFGSQARQPIIKMDTWSERINQLTKPLKLC